MGCPDRTCGADDCPTCYPWRGPCDNCGGRGCDCEEHRCDSCDGFVGQDHGFTLGEYAKACDCHRCSYCDRLTEPQPDPRACQCERCEDCGDRVATTCACVNEEKR